MKSIINHVAFIFKEIQRVGGGAIASTSVAVKEKPLIAPYQVKLIDPFDGLVISCLNTKSLLLMLMILENRVQLNGVIQPKVNLYVYRLDLVELFLNRLHGKKLMIMRRRPLTNVK